MGMHRMHHATLRDVCAPKWQNSTITKIAHNTYGIAMMEGAHEVH